jgi:hypothetical protein
MLERKHAGRAAPRGAARRSQQRPRQPALRHAVCRQPVRVRERGGAAGGIWLRAGGWVVRGGASQFVQVYASPICGDHHEVMVRVVKVGDAQGKGTARHLHCHFFSSAL